jgi:microcin C transport system permease protein
MLGRLIRDPLTRKRLRRFRAHRRAFASLWILLIAYIFSLGSELICGDRPLLVRYRGDWFFPVVRYYPEDTFTGNGRQTRPDYRALRDDPGFAGDPGNFMLFPAVPYSPYESIDPADLMDVQTVDATFTPLPRVLSLDLAADLRVVRARGATDVFFDTATDPQGVLLDDVWTIPPALRSAAAWRLANREADAFAVELTHRAASGRIVEASMPAFRPRSRPPDTVRVTLRERGGASQPVVLTFGRHGGLVNDPSRLWQALSEAEQATVRDHATQAVDAFVPPYSLAVGGVDYRVEVRKRDITWPHPPTRRHWMGIDSAGRDVFARILYGYRISISFALVLVTATMVLGVAVGAVQGFFGGKTDLVAQRLIEVWSALPFLYVMILLGSVYGRSFGLLLLCYGLFNWIGISYYMRAEFLRLRRSAYVEAARCLGVPTWRIMSRHILPNALTPLITFFPFLLVGAIAALYGLDYLGFGLPAPTASWGELLHQAQQFRWAWWLILFPAAAIFFVMLLGVFVGEGVRDAFDPRAFSRWE